MKLLEELIRPVGISGFEGDIAELISEKLRQYCPHVYRDKLGNVIGVRQSGKQNAKRLLVEAHMDEIGLIVTEVTKEGFLRFASMGGIDAKTLPASEVTVWGREPLFGVIGAVPPHLRDKSSADVPELRDMYIDAGLGEDAAGLVQVGDVISFNMQCMPLLGETAAGRVMDDRAGLAAILLFLEEIRHIQLDFDLYVAATVQEELGLRGAGVLAYALEPDASVSIDVCHGRTHSGPKDNTFELGGGVVISKGPGVHRGFTQKIAELAARYNIPIQIDVDGGSTGTNAWAIQVSRIGIPVIVLSIPLRYMHTNIETLDKRDVKNTALLLASIAKEGGAECFLNS